MSKSKIDKGNIYYVYVYVDPRNNSPFYVGKGCNNRFNEHLEYAKTKQTNNPKLAKIRKIIRETGQDPEIIFFSENLSEDEAFSLEMELIKRWGRKDNGTGCLLNRTDGGEGGSNGLIHTAEARQKISKAKKGNCSGENNTFYGKHHTEETKQKQSEKRTDINSPHFKKKKWTKDVKERDNYTCQNCFIKSDIKVWRIISKKINSELAFDIDNGIVLCKTCGALFTNINRTEESRQKQSKSMKGKFKSDLHKQHISEAKKGKKRSIESVQKQVNTQKGRLAWNKGLRGVYIPTEETKQKLSVALKGKYKGMPRSEESIRKQIETCRIKRELKQKGAV